MKIKVLLVDDEKEFVDALAERLEIRDFEVTKAFDGDEALARVGSGDVDVVVLDVMMPGKGGIEVLREIKATRPQIQVIILTGHASLETALDAMRHGAFDYLLKPVEMVDQLQLAIDRALLYAQMREINGLLAIASLREQHGRLKLREMEQGHAELIFYVRPDAAAAAPPRRSRRRGASSVVPSPRSAR